MSAITYSDRKFLIVQKKKKPSDGVISVRLSVVRKNLIYPVL